MKRAVLTFCLDLAFLAVAFVLVHWLHYGNLKISAANWDVLKLQVMVWIVVSVGAGKFTRIYWMNFVQGAGLLLKAWVVMLFLMSLMIVGMQWMHFSRTMAYGTVMGLVVMEVAALGFYQWLKGGATREEKSSSDSGGFWEVTRPLMILDGMLLVAAFLGVTFLKRGSFVLFKPYDDILLILLGLWLMGSLATRKFNKDNFHDFFVAMAPAVKTALFMAAGLAFFIYILRLEPVSRFQVFGPVFLLLVMEGVLFWLYVNYRKHGRVNGDIEDPAKVREMLGAEKRQVPLEPGPACPVTDPVDEKLRHALSFFDSRIYEMLSENVDLGSMDRCNCSLVSTDNMFNLDVMEDRGNQLIINLHKVNDIRWFNQYFLLVHQKLMPGGYFMGKAHTITTHRQYFREKYPKYLNTFYYVLSFIWGRVFPKLPWIKKFYFSVTRGKGRMVSRAEVLGRLCFCGFQIVEEKEFGHRFFFIARKASTPSMDENPTYGPLVRLNRGGLEGKPITVCKFRTMYPFSEYLQEYVFNLYGTEDGDKIANDFRITGWGEIFRKFWIDELPMLYNWFRGDLKLVGVRPLSDHKLSTYPATLQEKRKNVKPGLLPPFYAERPTTVNDFFLTEERYLDAYMKRPFSTDFKYFWKITWNIVVKRARSG